MDGLRPLALARRGAARIEYYILQGDVRAAYDEPGLALSAYERALQYDATLIEARRGALHYSLELGRLDAAELHLDALDKYLSGDEHKAYLEKVEALRDSIMHVAPELTPPSLETSQ